MLLRRPDPRLSFSRCFGSKAPVRWQADTPTGLHGHFDVLYTTDPRCGRHGQRPRVHGLRPVLIDNFRWQKAAITGVNQPQCDRCSMRTPNPRSFSRDPGQTQDLTGFQDIHLGIIQAGKPPPRPGFIEVRETRVELHFVRQGLLICYRRSRCLGQPLSHRHIESGPLRFNSHSPRRLHRQFRTPGQRSDLHSDRRFLRQQGPDLIVFVNRRRLRKGIFLNRRRIFPPMDGDDNRQ